MTGHIGDVPFSPIHAVPGARVHSGTSLQYHWQHAPDQIVLSTPEQEQAYSHIASEAANSTAIQGRRSKNFDPVLLRQRGFSPEADRRMIDEIVVARKTKARICLVKYAVKLNEARGAKPRFDKSQMKCIIARARHNEMREMRIIAMRARRGEGVLDMNALAARGIDREDIETFVKAIIDARKNGPTVSFEAHAAILNAVRLEALRFTTQESNRFSGRARDQFRRIAAKNQTSPASTEYDADNIVKKYYQEHPTEPQRVDPSSVYLVPAASISDLGDSIDPIRGENHSRVLPDRSIVHMGADDAHVFFHELGWPVVSEA